MLTTSAAAVPRRRPWRTWRRRRSSTCSSATPRGRGWSRARRWTGCRPARARSGSGSSSAWWPPRAMSASPPTRRPTSRRGSAIQPRSPARRSRPPGRCCRDDATPTSAGPPAPRAGLAPAATMTYDYRAHFGEVTLTQDLMSRRDERRWRLTPAPASGEHHDIVLYLGCNVLRTSHMVQTITAILDLLDLDYVAVGGPSYCCGIVHHTQGDVDAARGMSQGTLRLFERFSPREVVMWCPSCIYFYDEVQQLTLPFPFRQAAEFLVEHLPALRFTREVRQRVALHSHVQNDARRREGAAGRTLLEAVPGLTFVPIEPEPS